MRKLLNDLGIKDRDLPWKYSPKDERQVEWRKERKEYGFDERDTWNLHTTLTMLVYERLKFYREFAPISMDTPGHSHTYEIDGEELAYGAIVDRILAAFEDYLKGKGEDDIRTDEERYKEYQTAWELLGVIMPSLWW